MEDGEWRCIPEHVNSAMKSGGLSVRLADSTSSNLLQKVGIRGDEEKQCYGNAALDPPSPRGGPLCTYREMRQTTRGGDGDSSRPCFSLHEAASLSSSLPSHLTMMILDPLQRGRAMS